MVSKIFVLPEFQTMAWSASVARTPPKSSSSGEWRMAQCEPASMVRRIVPARPTIQQTLSEGAEPDVRSTSTLLVCRVQEVPPSLENSIMPARPARHKTLLFGTAIKFNLESPTSKPGEALISLKAAAGVGAGAGTAGLAAAAAR